ncbi:MULTISPECIES: M15 family metallopeptidase [unclassified Paenibacillus]|uniref:M15 family metallopeptidase n=1 Tax=unclassified Paenibacillus TaxID=185978 RepID=UPI00091A8959|nr:MULTISPECIES: M15 family metallopeptidase [unclassified Paenibacillus]SHN79464.1 D-alanyl-D-alanine carboxypeptidase [Paenibacillus sp. ov031]SLK08066.1 D-alanyl-D-alanine carboxypeptidase [Paenibacillus sp. RU5A]SOC70912.1 D-alanyl-D-alanine carboxypeptidase [Paenibacillus sp. RU26A]SOC73376.1 D-alanyl-D-alanine carboxypeptidase [Paenibacillus sp. RU5M]
MKLRTGRQRQVAVMLSSLMICGALLSACQDGSGSEENQNLNAAGSAQQESDGTTVHLTEDTGKDGNNTGGDDSSSSDNNNEGTDSGSGNASTGGEGSSDAGNGATAEDPLMEKRSISALQTTIDAQAVVTNSEAMTVIVNKQRSLPEGYEPDDLVEPNVPFSFDGPHEKRHMRKEAAEALEKLFAGAKADDIELRAVSGYRSYQRQVSIYNNNVKTKGKEYTDRVSSVPGHSEHQTGLAIDVSSPSVGNAIEEVFGTSKEGQWLAEHAAEYGFIIRYPKGEEGITGYVYEPWHIRYVGTDLAPDVVKSGLTLEEYFDEANIKL